MSSPTAALYAGSKSSAAGYRPADGRCLPSDGDRRFGTGRMGVMLVMLSMDAAVAVVSLLRSRRRILLSQMRR